MGYDIPSWITGGSLAAQTEIVIHELAHDFDVPGFVQNDAGSAVAQAINNQAVLQNCGDVISYLSGHN